MVGRPGIVVYTFNPSTLEAEAGRFLSSRPAWSTKVCTEKPCLKKSKKKKKKKKKKKRAKTKHIGAVFIFTVF